MPKTFSGPIRRLGGALALLCCSVTLADVPVELDPLVVTAGLQPLSLRDVASSVTVITWQDIEQKQARYLADLLRDVPGFAVSQAGGPGTQTQVRVRGAEANHLLVLIDGVRANDPGLSDEFQYQFALTDGIERIEIIRGPQSATWGSDAIAGVINIIRKKDAAGRYLAGRVEGGSFETLDASLEGGWTGNKLALNAGLSHLYSNGTNISRQGHEKDGARNTTGNIALDYDASESVSLRFSGQVVDAAGDYDDIDYVTTGLPVDANLMSKSRQSYLSGALGIRPPGKSWTGELSVNRMISDNDNFNSGLWTGSTGADTVELRLKGGLGFGPHGAVSQHVGFALERQELDFSQRGQASPFADPNQNQSYSADSLALEYVGKPLEGLTWTLSGRLDEYSAFRNARTWQAAASYRVSASLRLRASAGTGSKTPTFTERFGYYPDLFIGNPDLKPESSRGWEIGMDSDWADGRYALQLAWYEQSLEDEIDSFVFDPVSFLYTARNKSTGSRRRGLETVFDAHLGKPLTLTASYTYTDATERDAQRRRLREVRRPKHMASVSANYRFAGGRGNLNLNLDYSGPQRDVLYSPATYTLDRVRVGAHSVLDMAVAWRLTRSLQLTARVSNLLDEDYEEIVGFRRPGRALYAGLRGRFGM